MRSKLAFVVMMSVLATACGSPQRVAVDERTTVNRAAEIDEIGGALIRYVQPGDTLHAIAFIAGLDVNDIAAWNDINEMAKLQIGQRIRLTEPIGFDDSNSIEVATVPQVSPQIERPETNQTNSNQASSATPIPTSETPKAIDIEPPKTSNPNLLNAEWNWPLRGNVLRSFSQASGQQGIDISANVGDAVIATNAGEVVYVGNSLKGYGNLVIVKHDETFLSAYAHNSEIFVREGERVSAQQRIASVGTNRYKEAALHFQIRKNGQPVNPLLFLSKTG